MRIGFDAKRLFENKTGLGTYSRNLVNALIEDYPENEYYLYTPTKPSEEQVRKYLDISNIKIRYTEKVNKHYWRTRGIIKVLVNDQIEVYHGLSNELPFGIHKTGIKTAVTMHDLLFKQFPQDYNLVDRTIYDWKSKYACTHGDKVIAISQATKESIRENYNIPDSQISIIYQDIDPIFRKNQSPEDQTKLLNDLGVCEDFILFVGNDSKRKNLVTVLKALRQLEEKQNLVLVLNQANLNQECSDLIKSLDLTKQIQILTNISKKHLQALYTKSKCLVYPSLGEGWGLPIEEAIACNTYVIVPNLPPFNENSSKNKLYLSNPKDSREVVKLVKSIKQLNKNDSKKVSIQRENQTPYQQVYADLIP